MRIDHAAFFRMTKEEKLLTLSFWCDWLEEENHPLYEQVRALIRENKYPFLSSRQGGASWWEHDGERDRCNFIVLVSTKLFKKLQPSRFEGDIARYVTIEDAMLDLARVMSTRRAHAGTAHAGTDTR